MDLKLLPDTALEELTQTQRDRLAFVDLRLRFLGDIRRQDLVSRFGIQAAAATRDIGVYKALMPNNIGYDGRAKAYVVGKQFQPLFSFSAERVLSWLSAGFGDGVPTLFDSWVACESPMRLTQPDLSTLSCVTRAIYQQCPLKITYHSLSSGKTEREIVPFVLVDNGMRWHVRAFDRTRQEFRDFVITRITRPVLQQAARVLAQERSDQDIQWTRVVELELAPHPNQPHPEITKMDYSMDGGVLRMKLRAATVGYKLRQWNVDCSPDHSLRGHEYRLCLKDPLALYGVKNAVLAPGYREPRPDEARVID